MWYIPAARSSCKDSRGANDKSHEMLERKSERLFSYAILAPKASSPTPREKSVL